MGSITRDAVTQHWSVKVRSLSNERWLKRARGVARKRNKSRYDCTIMIVQLTNHCPGIVTACTPNDTSTLCFRALTSVLPAFTSRYTARRVRMCRSPCFHFGAPMHRQLHPGLFHRTIPICIHVFKFLRGIAMQHRKRRRCRWVRAVLVMYATFQICAVWKARHQFYFLYRHGSTTSKLQRLFSE